MTHLPEIPDTSTELLRFSTAGSVPVRLRL